MKISNVEEQWQEGDLKLKQVSLILQNVVKKFIDQQKREVTAVDNVSFEVEPGTFLTLLGPSGCGKTTTLRMIAGFEIPTSGKILINNVDVSSVPPWKRDTAMVFQSYALFPHMNVAENVAYGLKMRKIPKEDIDNRVKNILGLVGLSDYAGRPVGRLSGGQQQRVALARSLVVEPSVLLFDEPLSNLDVLLREQMRVEIRRIQQSVGITAIYVTHDRTEAMTLSDKIVLMNQGRVVQVGSPYDVYEYPNSKFVAEFMGKISFFPIENVNVENEVTYAKLDGRTMKILSKPTAQSEKYVLGCRPESMKVSLEEGDIKGTVKNVIFLGSYRECYIDTNFGEIMVKENPPFDMKIVQGREVFIQIIPELAKIIPDSSNSKSPG